MFSSGHRPDRGFTPPMVTDRDQQSRFIERSQEMMGMHWTTSRQDSGFHSDGRDKEEDKDGDKDEEDEDFTVPHVFRRTPSYSAQTHR